MRCAAKAWSASSRCSSRARRSTMSRAARSTTPTGAMEGRYFMIGADGSAFPVDIPRFPLIAPAVIS